MFNLARFARWTPKVTPWVPVNIIVRTPMNLQRFILCFLVCVTLAITACATGSAIVTGNTRDPVAPEQVRIYLEPPADFEVIGLVSASSEAGWTEQGSLDYATEELKNQAAKLGANGVLLVSSGYRGYAKTIQGKAIFVEER
jgi:hypothetical protein